jgi:hypothetical protein
VEAKLHFAPFTRGTQGRDNEGEGIRQRAKPVPILAELEPFSEVCCHGNLKSPCCVGSKGCYPGIRNKSALTADLPTRPDTVCRLALYQGRT